VAPATPAEPTAHSGDGGDELLAAMGHEPCTLDSLQARCGWPTALQARLLTLELAQQVPPARRPLQRIGLG
jgi:DNA processing protein